MRPNKTATPMPRILLVDDSPVDRTLAARLLQSEPTFEVVQAEHGREALDVLAHDPGIAVLVTDIQMPEMNGLELMEAVLHGQTHVPVVLVTSKGSEDMAVQALECGAASYVPKRRLATDLVGTVRRLIQLHREDEARAEVTGHLTSIAWEYALESDLELLIAVAARLAQALADFWDGDHTLRTQVSIALEEALTNAYFYGSLDLDPQLRVRDHKQFYRQADERGRDPSWRDRKVVVTAKYTREAAAITIRDSGRGFDVSRLPRDGEDDDFDQLHGRGLRLMRTFMDDVKYGAAGTEVTLIKRRQAE